MARVHNDGTRRVSWQRIVIEGATIIFSVLFALGVDQFRQSRNEKILADRVSHTIRAEVSDNRVLVSAAAAYHDTLLADMQAGTRLRRATSIPLAEWNARRNDRSALRAYVVERLMDAGHAVSPAFAVRRNKDGAFLLVDMDLEAPVHIVGDSVELFLPRGIQLRSAMIRNTAWETAQATGALIRMPVPLVAAMADLYQLQRTYQGSASDVLQSLYSNTFTVSALQDLTFWEKQLLGRYARVDSLLH